MTHPARPTTLPPHLAPSQRPRPTSAAQRGVVLIIALILLMVISLLAATSMRNASSSESIAGNVRTTELATQAAEIALRHCESSTVQATKNYANTSPWYYTTTFVNSNIVRAATSVAWQSTSTWDSGSSTMVFVLPSTVMGGTGTYKRPAECMVESLTGTNVVSTNAQFQITTRGFGPEVTSTSGRPDGTEVWLQSTIEIQ